MVTLPSRITTIRTMVKTWMAIISLLQVSSATAFSFPSSTSRLFRPPGSLSTTATTSSTCSSVEGSARSSSSPSSFSQLNFSIRNKSIYPPTKQQRRGWNYWRRIQRMSAAAASSSSTESNEESIKSLSPSAATTVSSAANNGEEGEELTKLRKENKLLQERLKLLQSHNDQLLLKEQHQKQKQQQQLEQRLILEDFEGGGIPTYDARGGVVDGWSKSERRYTEPWDENGEYIEFQVDADNNATTRIGRIPSEAHDEDDELGLSLSDPAEDEVCEYDDQSNKWMSGIGECPLEPNVSFLDAMKSRAQWLVGLLALQSCSGFILSRNELLLQDHPVIVYFLTMLVGAGGNAGNQASVRVIRGLALGTLNPQTQSQFLSRELRMAFALSVILSVAGFVRATVFMTPFPETLAVTLALSIIVFSSICLGAVLPLLLQKVGVDPAHSSTTIQVVMDILGVLLTVFISTTVLDSEFGKTLINALGNIGLG